MHSTVLDAQEQAEATGNISSGATQLQRLITSHAQMSEEVAITADRLGQLAEALRELVPKQEPNGAAPEPRQVPPSATPMPGQPAVA
jgi:hypothetical protein